MAFLDYDQFINEEENFDGISEKVKFLLWLVINDKDFLSFHFEPEQRNTGTTFNHGASPNTYTDGTRSQYNTSEPDYDNESGNIEEDMSIHFGNDESVIINANWSYHIIRGWVSNDYEQPDDPDEVEAEEPEINSVYYYDEEGEEIEFNYQKHPEIFDLATELIGEQTPEFSYSKTQLERMKALEQRIESDPKLKEWKEELQNSYHRRGDTLGKNVGLT